MERKEPSLVPEWLKGAAGGGTGGAIQFSQQFLHQDGSESLLSPIHRNSPPEIGVKTRLGESDSSAHVITSKREYQSSWLRPGSSSSVLSRGSNPDRDAFSYSKPSYAFGRGSFYQSNDRDSHVSFDKDRAYGDWNKDRASAFTAFNDKDKEQESTYFSALRHMSAGKATSYDIESPLRRAQSMGALRRVVVNGKKELASELLGARTDEMHVPSTRAATPPALMPVASSESVYSIRGTKDYHASSDLATSSQHTANNSNFVKEVTQAAVTSSVFKLAEETSSTRNLTPSKLAAENLCLDELELRQSRQLIPLKPAFPKNKVGSPREKPKLKVMRSVELGQSLVPRAVQALSQSSIDPRWAQLQVRHEYSKPMQNKLIVRKNNKEIITPSVPVVASTIKLESSSPAGVLGVAIDPMATSQTSGVSNFVRKPKQLFDRRSVPILSTPPNSGIDVGSIQRPKEQSAAVEDKRFSIQVQNRSDFFNTLRRKAAESAASQSNVVRTDTFSGDKTEEDCDKGEMEIDLGISRNYAHDLSKLRERSKDIVDHASQSCCTDNADNTISLDMDCGKKGDIPENDSTFTEVEFVETKSSIDISGKVSDVTTNFKEEEEAFLRSLGWKDNAEGEEALTEEEINAFYQLHGDFLATKVRTSSHKQRLEYFVTHSNSESPTSISSDLTPSEADSAAEVDVQR